MSIEKIQSAIEGLKMLDLSKEPYKEANDLMQQLGKSLVYVHTFYPGKVIFRARPNQDGKSFNNLKELSYKPQEFNKTYQRASTPYTTMFYGAFIPEDIKEGDLDCSQLTGCFEVCDLLRNGSNSDGEQTLTFGRWVVTEPINVVTLVHNGDYTTNNPSLKFMKEEYDKFLSQFSEDVVQSSRLVTDFFAKEFAKENISNHLDYMLSAIYAERIPHLSTQEVLLSGVAYPSVRTGGRGFNIAINPETADKALSLEGVVECTLYKMGSQTLVDNDKQVYLEKGQTDFELEPITNPENHWGRELVYKILKGEITLAS